MIKLKVFESTVGNLNRQIGQYIKMNDIKREDILEYRSEFVHYEGFNAICRVHLSWWQEGDSN